MSRHDGASAPSAVGLRERNKRATRSGLILAARQLLAQRGGFTADEIAEQAGVSRATYFNYFPGKDDLLRALYAEHMASLAEVVDRLLAEDLDTYSRIVGVFVDFAEAAQQYPDYLRSVTAEFERTFAAPDISVRHTEMFNIQVIRIIEEGVRRGEVRTDHEPRFLAQMIGAIYQSTIRYWRQDADFAVETFTLAGRFVGEALGPPRTGRADA